MLAKKFNDNAFILNERGGGEFFASKLAPTGLRFRAGREQSRCESARYRPILPARFPMASWLPRLSPMGACIRANSASPNPPIRRSRSKRFCEVCNDPITPM